MIIRRKYQHRAGNLREKHDLCRSAAVFSPVAAAYAEQNTPSDYHKTVHCIPRSAGIISVSSVKFFSVNRLEEHNSNHTVNEGIKRQRRITFNRHLFTDILQLQSGS